ncbi:MAG: putative metallopeptidase [Promethearchaeota archaeon]|jgi:hypothetical protein
MTQVKPEYVEIEEFNNLAGRLVEKYPERFSQIDVDQIVAYVVVNKDRPEGKTRPYDMTGTTPPESFTNSKTYFVWVFNDVWERTQQQKLALIFSALSRIDPANPGKVQPWDYTDQKEMVKNFGADWHERGDLPDLLGADVDLK